MRMNSATDTAAQPALIGVGLAALAVERTAGAGTVKPPDDVGPGDAADAQRGVGAGDQKRSREAAGGDRCCGRAGLRPKPRHKRAGCRRRRLRELIDPFLEELLIGPQIRQLIGARRGKASQQRNRCHAADIPHSGHRSPYRIIVSRFLPVRLTRGCGSLEIGRPPLSRATISRRRPRSSALFDFRGVFVAAWPGCNRPPPVPPQLAGES